MSSFPLWSGHTPESDSEQELVIVSLEGARDLSS